MKSVKLEDACPDIEELAACLEPLSHESADLTDHLSRCTSCQRILDSLAGQPEWWEEAKESLNTWHEGQDVTHIAKSICVLNGELPSAQTDPLCEHELEQMQRLLDAPSHPELLGRIGRYELEQLVGRGGMGLVFRGYDAELHRVVAVKTLAVHLLPNRSARERFIREARACAALSHPNIVPIYDVLTEGPVPALVMQYIAGPTLQAWLDKHGAMPSDQALRLVCQVSDALTAAHEMGLVHRDIKPGNILLDAGESRALLTDFGLVRALDEASLTHSGLLAGTPDYMSPEQARGESVDERTDLFSLGATLFTMLVGKPPFRFTSDNGFEYGAEGGQGEEQPSPMAILHRICNEPYPSLKNSASKFPSGIMELLDELLAKTPRARIHSAEELRQRSYQLLSNPQAVHWRRRFSRRLGLGLVAGATVVTVLLLVWLDPLGENSNPTWLPAEIEQTGRMLTTFEEHFGVQDATLDDQDAILDEKELAAAQQSWSAIESEVRQLNSLLEQLESNAKRSANLRSRDPLDQTLEQLLLELDQMESTLLQ